MWCIKSVARHVYLCFLPILMDAILVIVTVDFRVHVHILKFCVSTLRIKMFITKVPTSSINSVLLATELCLTHCFWFYL